MAHNYKVWGKTLVVARNTLRSAFNRMNQDGKITSAVVVH
jgi:hypothetical protein